VSSVSQWWNASCPMLPLLFAASIAVSIAAWQTKITP
jgi:hypothetical protein